jgi:hypothetical protein
MNKKLIAKEWLVFVVGFSFGILILPFILTLLLFGSLKEFGGFYEALFSKRNFIIPLLVVLAPYLLTQIVRATAWSVKQLKQK